jgi:hypothetical protein
MDDYTHTPTPADPAKVPATVTVSRLDDGRYQVTTDVQGLDPHNGTAIFLNVAKTFALKGCADLAATARLIDALIEHAKTHVG